MRPPLGSAAALHWLMDSAQARPRLPVCRPPEFRRKKQTFLNEAAQQPPYMSIISSVVPGHLKHKHSVDSSHVDCCSFPLIFSIMFDPEQNTAGKEPLYYQSVSIGDRVIVCSSGHWTSLGQSHGFSIRTGLDVTHKSPV